MVVAKLVMNKAKLMYTFLESVQQFVDEPNFQLTRKALTIKEMDVSRVAMLDYAIPANNFDDLTVAEEGFFCFNINDVLTLMKGLSANTSATFAIGKKRLTMTLRDSRIRNRSFNLLDPIETPESPPKVEEKFTAHLVVDAKPFVEDVLSFSKLAHAVIFKVVNDTLTLEAKDLFTTVEASNIYKIGQDMLRDGNVTGDKPIKATYSVEYLKMVAPRLVKKGIQSRKRMCETADLDFASDLPMRITLNNKVYGRLVHWLAPRIEVE